MGMDLGAIKSKLSALQSQKQGGQKRDMSLILWKPTVGKHSVRIVPALWDKANPFKEILVHYGIGNRTMISLVNFGEKDPIVEFAKQLASSGDKENWMMSRKLEPKMRVFTPVIVRGEEEKGVRLWEFGKQIYAELLSLADDPDIGDYTDVIQEYPYDEMKEALLGWLNPEETTDEPAPATPKQEAAPVEKPASLSLNTPKAKPSIDEEFDDLFK